MKTYRVLFDGERLDSLCLRFYGSLEAFSELLASNSHLEALLRRGDIVNLPNIEPKESEKGNALW